MGERTSYAPGTFSWVDLTTTDPATAKDFYAALFRWTYEDAPTGDGGHYTMVRRDGHDVAGLSAMPEPLREQGVPPHWTSYVTVEDADAAAARATELGGSVHLGPFDVMRAGRMAVVADPQGAAFAVWQAREHIGATLVNDPGSLTMNELATSDLEDARRFYGELFGWRAQQLSDQPPYFSLHNGDRLNGGLTSLPAGAENVPPHWRPYFTVEDLDAAVATSGERGGRTLLRPVQIPAGRVAALADPQGAVFCLFEGEVDP